MTTETERLDARALLEGLRGSAKAFRDYPVYNSEGDGAFLTVQADEADQAAAAIEALTTELAASNARVKRLEEALVEISNKDEVVGDAWEAGYNHAIYECGETARAALADDGVAK